MGGEEREQVFTRTDQEYSTYIEDESEGRGLLADKLRWLCIISQWLHARLISGPSDLATQQETGSFKISLKQRQDRGKT